MPELIQLLRVRTRIWTCVELIYLIITLSHFRHAFLSPNIVNIQCFNFCNNLYLKSYICNFLPWYTVNKSITVCMEGMGYLKQISCLQGVYYLIEDMYISKTIVKSNIVKRTGLGITSYECE